MADIDLTLRDTSRAENPPHPLYEGTIAEDAESSESEIAVLRTEFSEFLRQGPCRFPMSNGSTLPRRGDICLIAYDEQGEPWIVSWFPRAGYAAMINAISSIQDLLSRRVTDSRGDTLPFGLRRAFQWRRPLTSTRLTGPDIPEGYESWTDQVVVPEDDTGPERLNATAGAQALNFFARLAQYGHHGDVHQDVHFWAEALLPLQWSDPDKLNYGGFMASPNSNTVSALGTGEMGLALIEAWKATGEPRYREAAIRAAYFCLKLSDPNTYWFPKYNVNPINRTVGGVTWYGFCDEVTAADKITTTCTNWNLKAAELCEAVYRLNGDTDLHDAAMQARDFMAYGALNFFDYFAPSSNVDPTFVSVVWPNIANSPNDHNWHKAGDSAGPPPTTTVGTDQLEYPWPALINLGYDEQAVLDVYDSVVARPANDGTNPFDLLFDSRKCFTGFLRDGIFFGTYYDTQGAGSLAGLKARYRPDHFNASLDILLYVATKGGLVDGNFNTIGSNMVTYWFATQGTIVLASAGLGLLNALQGRV